MRLRIISALALLAIIVGVSYTATTEYRQSSAFLQHKYRGLNREFFENGLPAAQIEWADLSHEGHDGDMGQTYRDGKGLFEILVDRRTNAADQDLEDTIEHETCHIVTWGAEQDAHGPVWRA